MLANGVGSKQFHRGPPTRVQEMPDPMAVPDDPRDELAESLDLELSRLPEKYRSPIILCALAGLTHRRATI